MLRRLHRLLPAILSLAIFLGVAGARDLAPLFWQDTESQLHHCGFLPGPGDAAPDGSHHDAGAECCPYCCPPLAPPAHASANYSVTRFESELLGRLTAPPEKPWGRIQGAHWARAPPAAL